MSNSRNTLHPEETIQKILISTTSRMIGEVDLDGFLISHARQYNNPAGNIRMEENPVSRSGYIVAFKTEPYEKEVGTMIPDYSPVGEIVCSYLSLIYGKRFDCHGLVEGSGSYHTPDLSVYSEISNPNLPFNSHKERKCFSVLLNMQKFTPFASVLMNTDSDSAFQTRLNAACKFYMQALRSAEQQPEVAYLHLITSGEILSGFFNYEKKELMDEDILRSLLAIENELENGAKVKNIIENRVLGIKRKFVKSICSLIDEKFYVTIGSRLFGPSIKPESLKANVAAAYDLRSKYVHTGVPFGNWVSPMTNLSDLQHGCPVVGDKEYSKILERAPTFIGLERLIRYCILNYMIGNGFSMLSEMRENA